MRWGGAVADFGNLRMAVTTESGKGLLIVMPTIEPGTVYRTPLTLVGPPADTVVEDAHLRAVLVSLRTTQSGFITRPSAEFPGWTEHLMRFSFGEKDHWIGLQASPVGYSQEGEEGDTPGSTAD
jgi:hypothetical protein